MAENRGTSRLFVRVCIFVSGFLRGTEINMNRHGWASMLLGLAAFATATVVLVPAGAVRNHVPWAAATVITTARTTNGVAASALSRESLRRCCRVIAMTMSASRTAMLSTQRTAEGAAPPLGLPALTLPAVSDASTLKCASEGCSTPTLAGVPSSPSRAPRTDVSTWVCPTLPVPPADVPVAPPGTHGDPGDWKG